jgi:hypothetical protein
MALSVTAARMTVTVGARANVWTCTTESRADSNGASTEIHARSFGPLSEPRYWRGGFL